jgi:serine/threonine protein kinase
MLKDKQPVFTGGHGATFRIGEGSQLSALGVPAGQTAIVKVALRENNSAHAHYAKEAKMLTALWHISCIPDILAVCPQRLAIILTEVGRWNMQALIPRKPDGKHPARPTPDPLVNASDIMNVQRRKALLRTMFGALRDFHGQSFVHGDLSPNNLRVSWNLDTRTFQVFLIDFGSAAISGGAHEACGTPAFRSTHMYNARYVSPATDLLAALLISCRVLGWRPANGDALLKIFAPQTPPARPVKPYQTLGSGKDDQGVARVAAALVMRPHARARRKKSKQKTHDALAAAVRESKRHPVTRKRKAPPDNSDLELHLFGTQTHADEFRLLFLPTSNHWADTATTNAPIEEALALLFSMSQIVAPFCTSSPVYRVKEYVKAYDSLMDLLARD